MKRGLVFGKFLPFHKGHKALIGFALKHCDELIVLVCGSDKEDISTQTRVDWITNTFKKNSKILVHGFDYKEAELPNTSESSRSVSQLWAAKFKTILPFFDILITSEKYGEYVAEYLNIRHITFDENRNKTPISSSMIRQNPIKYWDYISKAAKPYFQKKVVLLGTESTGKTTLCSALAHYFSASLVSEVGRDIVSDSTDFTKDNLELIVQQHSEKIIQVQTDGQPLIVMDTDIHITQSYSKYAFGEYLEVDKSIYKLHHANLYLYLNNDVPFVQDGSRMTETMRNELDKSHRQTLKYFGISYHEIKGNWSQRLQKSVGLVEEIMQREF